MRSAVLAAVVLLNVHDIQAQESAAASVWERECTVWHSGAAIWNAPTVDAARGVIYAATGNQYTGPEREAGDAVLAFGVE